MLQSVLTEETANPDPHAQFRLWFDDAKAAAVPEPNAMAVASVSATGAPSSRMVLLKGHGEDGFVFFTNYGSRKAQELEHNRRVALLFFWPTLQRQIRIEGVVGRTTREESADYFRTRARESQIGAWASAQSEIITTRAGLEQRVVELEREYAGREVPVPPFWGGFRVTADRFEFWQGREHRLHDRIVYEKDGALWKIARLSP
ncbi:MAG TPA: pyridoxamine 5'-phosphate oxidase [Polyangiaceae bacterium]|jgi:pyridoxamine 5'-phosphate oxidase